MEFNNEIIQEPPKESDFNDPFQDFENIKETPNAGETLDETSFLRTNRYHLIFDENDVEKEKKRLSKYMYGPSILLARNQQEYYKILSFRKHKLFNMKTINEIESKYVPSDNYFNTIEKYKKNFESPNERIIRFFVRFFFFEE